MSYEDRHRANVREDAIGTNGGILVVDIRDRTKALSFTSQYFETMNHGGVRFLIFCDSKERNRRNICYK